MIEIMGELKMNKKLYYLILIFLGFIWSGFSMQHVKANMMSVPSEVSGGQITTQSFQNKNTPIPVDEQSETSISKTSLADYGSQYFTQVSFTDIAGNQLAKVDDSDKVKVNYSFSIPGNVHKNETMSIQLPTQLQMVNYTDFPIMDTSGVTIANASIDKGTGLISIIFTSAVENKTDIKGSLFFWAKFDKEKLLEGENSFSMPLQGVTTDLTLNVHKTKNTGTGTTNPTVIFKSGSFDKNDPSLINWTITVNNAHQNLFDPKVTDTIGPGQKLISGTFSFNYRDENKKSLRKFTLPTGNDVSEGFTRVSLTSTGFEMSLESLGSYSIINHYYSVVVNYQTKIDSSTVRYVNSAGMLDELAQPQKRNASVTDYGNGGVASGSVQDGIDMLTDIIDTASGVDSTDLIPEDMSKLKDATNTAQEVVDDETVTQDKLDEASNQLGKVLEEVVPSKVPPIDEAVAKALKELEQLIKKVKTTDSSLYTEKSWQVVEDAVKESEKLISNENEHPGSTSLQSVQKSTSQLNQALNSLITKEHEQLQTALNQLQKLVNIAEAFNKTLYTEESWAALMKAKEEAKRTIVSGISKVTLQEISTKQRQLQKAIEDLIKKVTWSSVSTSQKGIYPKYQKSTNKNLPATGEHSNLLLILGGFFILSFVLLLEVQKNKKLRK